MDNVELEKLLAKYKRKIERFDKILKQGDKQQLQLYKLYNTIEEQKKEIEELYKYTIEQQEIAKFKLESLLVNDCKEKTKIIFKASDILSGDYYSIFKLKNGGILIYLLDGQGHGVSPALTIFAIATNMLQILNYKSNDFEYIVKTIFNEAKKFLMSGEQLSYFLIYIHNDYKTIDFTGGGMYPFYIKTEDNKIQKVKVNNMPFINTHPIPEIERINLEGKLVDLLLYSDGILENRELDMSKYHPREVIKNTKLIDELKEKVKDIKFLDDVTLINLFSKL